MTELVGDGVKDGDGTCSGGAGMAVDACRVDGVVAGLGSGVPGRSANGLKPL